MNRRTVAAACLAASPIFVTASHFVWPAHSEGSDAQQLRVAGAHAGQWVAAAVIETVGWLLLVPALVVVWQSVAGRGRRLTAIGVWLAIAGVFGYYGSGLMNVVTVELGRQPNTGAMLDVVHALKHDGAMVALLVAPLLIGTVALALVFVGLARAGWVGWWAPVAVFVAIVASQVLTSSDNAALLALAFLPLTIADLVAAARLAGVQRSVQRKVPQQNPAPADTIA